MNVQHISILAAPAFISTLAQLAGQAPLAGTWVNALVNYGALGLWVIYLVWRDNKESQKRDTQHREHIEAQKAIEKAFRSNTNATLVAVLSLKSLDNAFTELAESIKRENETPIG